MSKSSSLSKELMSMARMARDQGWEVTETGGGHLKWTPPGGGEFYISSASPSSQRTIVNVKKDLATRGMVWDSGEARRMAKSAKTIQSALDNHRSEVTEAYRILNLAWNKDLYGGSPADLDPIMALVLVKFTSGTSLKPSLDLRCDCRKQFFYPLAFFNHLLTCNKVNFQMNADPDKEVISMERDMTNPPYRERLECAECDFYCWITQPWMLEKHYAADHGKVPCPYCGKFYSKNRGGLSKHMVACDEKPEPGAEPEPSVEVLDPLDPANARQFIRKVTPTSHPDWFPAPPMLAPLGEYDNTPCTVCAQPLGQGRGASAVCWNPLCWEKINSYFSERGADAMAAVTDYLTGQAEFIIEHIGPEEWSEAQRKHKQREAKRQSRARLAAQRESSSADLDEPVGDVVEQSASRRLEPEPDIVPESPEPARSHEPEPDISVPDGGPARGGSSSLVPSDSTPAAVLDDDDDTLWALLEIVLDGPVMMNRESLAAVQQWMEATRTLMHLKAKQ